MTDLTMADNALVDDGINADAPVTVAPPAPEAPAEPKVWSAERFQQRLQERLKSKDEAVAREVFDADAGNEIKAVKLARKYGLHPSVVTPNLNEYEIRDLAERFGAAPPKVRNFLGSDRVNAMLGYQDIENLGVIERVAQNLFEFGKGTPEGVGTLAGSALKGFGALIETASPELRPYLSELAQLDKGNAAAVADLRRRADVGLGGKDRFSFHSAMSDVLEGADTGANLQRQMVPKVTDTWGYQAGQAIQRDANIFPARPGFEDSTGRALGSGFGTLLAGAAISALTGPIGGTLAFGASGAGEAVDNAVRAGATDTDIVSAARLGIIPGLTDSVPIETLLGRIPVPGGRIVKLAVGELGPALRAIGRIGWQAAIEGIQEGGQAFLQNLIAREVYKPEQSLTEGLPGDAGIGAGVGGIAATAKEIAMLVAGRRARGGHPFHAAKEIDQETRQAETAQAQAQNLADVIERVQSSPLTQNDPERMKALLGEIAGQDGAVYMPATEVARLYQEGKINDAVLNQWGVLDQVAEVRRTGGDLVIPAASFMTSEMAKEAVAEVTQSVRMSASAMTARESEAFLSERQARIDDLIERMSVANEARPDGAFIFDTIQNAVIAAGRSAAEAKAYAALTAERYIRRAADRADTSPDSLFVKDNFRVLGPGMEAGVRAIVRDEMDVVIARLLSGREVKTPKTPVLDLLKKRGGVQPGSPLAKDLAGMGITPKTNRGLFLPSGMAAADDIVASEDTILTDNGIAVDANGYAQPDALMDAIREEIAGRPWQTQAEKDRIARLDAPVAELEKVMGAAGFDWRNASPEAIRAFLETALSPEPVIAGAAETVLEQSERAAPAFYSAVERAVEGLKQEKGNGAQMLAMLQKTPGVKAEEIAWLGVDAFLAGKKSVTKAELLEHVRANQVEVREVTKGGGISDADRAAMEDWLRGEIGSEARSMVESMTAGEQSAITHAETLGAPVELVAPFKGRFRDNAPKFSQYVLPGGENYRELLLTLPEKKGNDLVRYLNLYPAVMRNVKEEADVSQARKFNAQFRESLRDYTDAEVLAEWENVKAGKKPDAPNFKSSHFLEPNILAHIRFNERTDADGKRALFIEEIQSDWHQAGRKKGYKSDNPNSLVYDIYDRNGNRIARQPTLEAAQRLAENYRNGNTPAQQRANRPGEPAEVREVRGDVGVPDAPLKKTWQETAFRRMVRYAAENGFDSVAWTTGEQQAERYDLSKQVDAISYAKESAGTWSFSARKGKETLARQSGLDDAALADAVGKEIADKIKAGVGREVGAPEGSGELSGVNLKVGGEGMAGFYDKILPAYANKFGKAFGVKAGIVQINTAGDKPTAYNDFEDYTKRGKASSAAVHSLPITPAMRDSVVTQGVPLFQPDGSGFKRGSFERQTDPYGDIVNIIRLTKNADRSTFLHESGHFWLFQLIEDSYDPAVTDDARVRLQADLQTTLDLFGLKIDVKASNPDAILSQITTDMHETWARMTEAYFMEGKAPSKELRSLFAKFSGWLISIYRKLRALNVDLTDDVRGVFDRLLATEDAIAEARDHRMYAVPTDLAESLTAAEKANIEKLAEQAVLEARMDLQGRVARDIEREKADEWKAEKKAAKETIRLAVRRQPIYAAVNLLKGGANAEGDQIVNEDGTPRQFKLDRKEAIERYGEEIVGLMPGGIWAKKGDPSISMDVMASLAGFDSADSLKLGLMTAKGMPEKAAIAAEVDAEMKRRHGDLMANIAEEAADAVANDKQMELMALQARYIRRIAGDKMRQAATRQGTREGAAPLSEAREAVTDASTMVDAVERSGAPAEAVASAQVGEELARVAQSAQAPMRAAQGAAVATVKRLPPVAYDVGVIKEAATQFVLGKKVRDLGTPERYEQQASRLTRDIEKAIAGRDYNRAQYLMEQRLFNLQLAREVRKAGTQIERTREYLDKFNGRKVREAMGKAGADYLERIDGLLEQYEFRRASNRDLDRRKALQEWLAAQEEAGLAPVVPPAVLERSQMVNYRSVSYGELMDLRDAVKSIEHVAQFKNKLLANKQKRELQAVVEEAVANIQASIPPLPPNVNPQRDNFKSKWNATVVSGLALVTKARTYFVAMDGVEAGGLLDRLILTPIRNGEVRVSRRKDIEGRRFKTLIERHYGKGALKWGSPKTAVFIPEINASLTLEERLAVALNWGNESNRQAILDDEKRGWDQSGVQAILDTLEKRDWDFVQGTWDYINTFWPEVAETQRQRTGLPPEKVEAAKVQTKFGEYAGGYYPLKYDPEMSPRTAENDINSEFKAMNAGRYAAAATKRGHTKERVGSGKQSPMLSLNVIPQHVNQVLTDVELGPAISDAWKILQHKDMKAAISGHMGVEVTRQLDVWVKDVAAGSIHAGDRLSKMLRGLRTSVSAGAMGFKLSTTLIQVTGFTQTAVRVGYAHTLLGMAKFVANPMKASREVRAMSPFMDIRTRTFQRDVADALTQARGVGGIKGNVLASLFWPIAKMQQMVDTPTWLAGYDRAVKEGKTGDDAIAFADAMVESSQSSSLMSNLSPVERGTVSQGTRLSEFVKLWTTFYSFFNAKLNLAMQRTQATDFRRPGQVAELAADYLMLFWVEAALGDLMLRQLPDAISGDDKDDDEKTLMTGIWHQVALTFYSMTGTLPLLREAAGAMQGFDAGPGSSRALGDLGKGAAQVVKAGRAALSEDEDVNGWQLIRALIAAGNVVSPIKYPAAQINTAVRAMEKSAKDKDVSMIDYLISRPK